MPRILSGVIADESNVKAINRWAIVVAKALYAALPSNSCACHVANAWQLSAQNARCGSIGIHIS